MKLTNLMTILRLALLPMLLLICNLHLLAPVSPTQFIYQQDMVDAGEWWRLITHPFVHVSWYHLLLDSTAVLLIWRELPRSSFMEKSFIACWCAAGGLLGALLFSPLVHQTGYCGLSGMGHGMMFYLGLCWLFYSPADESTARFTSPAFYGGLTLVALGGLKGLYEAISGKVVFASFHHGSIGVPIVEAHLGGIISGGICFSMVHLFTLAKKRNWFSGAPVQEF